MGLHFTGFPLPLRVRLITVGEQNSLGEGHEESAQMFKTNISKCIACSPKIKNKNKKDLH